MQLFTANCRTKIRLGLHIDIKTFCAENHKAETVINQPDPGEKLVGVFEIIKLVVRNDMNNCRTALLFSVLYY